MAPRSGRSRRLAADLRMARRARRHGARSALRIIWEARRADIRPSLGFALVEKESGFRNIFGHDPGGPHPGQRVTRLKVQDVLNARISNGVGYTQLTYKPYIREAVHMGGAHIVKYQLRVGFRALHDNIKRHRSEHAGIRAYNGTGWRAEQYADDLQRRAEKWHRILLGR